jgi:monoamine oxidase
MVRVIQDKVYREENLHSRSILGGIDFNQREIVYLADHPWWEIPLIYIQPYVDRIEKEDTPFGWGLDELDRMSLMDLLKREGASSPVLSGDVYGGNSGSALGYIWNAAMKQLRGAPLLSRDLFRIKGETNA